LKPGASTELGNAGQDQRPDQLGSSRGELERNATTEGVPQHDDRIGKFLQYR
jgi:hypothetical protein